uniref:TPR_REGION domain-containing protein n=1 Tax=Syphacia muris TaxID=451379 RepID=A0A0N5ALQ9_9BILA
MENLTADLKRKLKSIRSHLDSRCDQKAKELIEELLEEGVKDYFLYLFAAVVCSREENVLKAFEYYKKAVAVESSHASAWQGIFKLYENGDLRFDDFAVTALDKLISLTPEEKRLPLQKKRADVLLGLQKYDVILADKQLMDSEEFCLCAICAIVNGEKKYSDIERALCDKCFKRLETCHDSEILDLKIAQYNCALAENVLTIREEILKYVNHGGTSIWDSWAIRQMRFVLGVNYFSSHQIDPETCCAIKNIKQTVFEVIYTYIINKDTVAALNFINTLGDDEYDWPLLMIIIPTLLLHQHYERVLLLLDKPLPVMFNALESESEHAVDAARIEAYYNIGDDESIKHLNQLLQTCKFNQFSKAILLYLLCSREDFTKGDLEIQLITEPFIKEEDKSYWRAVFAKDHGNLKVNLFLIAEAKAQAELSLKCDPASWRKMLLLAEILLGLNPNDKLATSLLIKVVNSRVTYVKAAKINPCDSRIFLCLGESLVNVNRAKARQCVERARKIRPQSLDVAKLCDRLLGLEGKKTEQLQYICQFLDINPHCEWALRRRALLKMDLEKNDEAVEDLQRIMRREPGDIIIWNALAEAYRRRGNLQSSIKAFSKVIEMDPSNCNAYINLIQIYHLTGQLEDAVERCKSFNMTFANKSPKDFFGNCVLLLRGSSLLKLAQKSANSEKFLLLNELFGIIEQVLSSNKTFVTAYRVAASALLMTTLFGLKTFKRFRFPISWGILTPTDALNLSAQYFCVVVKMCPTWAGSWNDLGVVLTKKAQITKESTLATKAKLCIKRAIILCKYSHVRSVYWTNLSQAVDLLGNKFHTQHCLIRALELNKRNDRAWCLLGLFYLNNDKIVLAKQALDMAQKCNPELAEMWCAMALIAEQQAHYDTMDLYRHSLTIKPTELAIKKYAYYLMQKRKEGKLCDNATMFIFESLHEYFGISSRSDELKFYLALLAEHFWHLNEAAYYINRCDNFPIKALNQVHNERIKIKLHEGTYQSEHCVLKEYSNLYSQPVHEVYETLCNLCPNYKSVFQAIDSGDDQGFRECVSSGELRISIVILISACIAFSKKLTADMLNTLDEIYRHHRLMEVYPPDKQIDPNDEFSYDIKDQGELVTVRQDNLSEHLYELLSQKKKEFQAKFYEENVIVDPFAEEN